ncbi:hypothetical protein JKP88DRAFT_225304 [Tribonema minus]|uniref:Uncharacterized protein n=1 Tax=Tribonema minus TaxID=303371 RepID=A0A835YNY3_9STRA|nr:hypothetical protein JKP88DRAFT_225304 [Tribonema minus]
MDLRGRHEALKKRIHNFRIPLSPRGQLAMQVVYFTVPFVGGMAIMQWARSKADKNLEHLQVVEAAATQQQNKAFQQVLSQSAADG